MTKPYINYVFFNYVPLNNNYLCDNDIISSLIFIQASKSNSTDKNCRYSYASRRERILS